MYSRTDKNTRQQPDAITSVAGGKQSADQSRYAAPDNEPSAQIQLLADGSPRVKQFRALQAAADSRPQTMQNTGQAGSMQAVSRPEGLETGTVAQLTSWRFAGGAWVAESSSSGDTDPHPLPDAFCTANSITPGAHDRYDQQHGIYRSFGSARDKTESRGKAKKRPKNYGGFFDADREVTPYGRFKPREADEQRSKSHQGPHLAAFVLKRTVFDIAQNMGLTPDQILDSKLAPNPRQAAQMMMDMLKARGISYKDGALSTWYRDYKKAYLLAKSGKKGSKKAIKQVMEAHPLTAYRIGEVASDAELAGKNESSSMALSDIDLLLGADRSTGLPGGLTTVDSGYSGEGWAGGDKDREDYIFNYALAATGRPPSPSPYAEAPSSPTHDDDW